MNLQELKALIDSEPSNTSKTDQQVLDWLNSDSDQYHQKLVNARQIMAELGATIGATILDKLEAVSATQPPVKWAMKFLDKDGIDVGNPETRGMLDQFVVAAILTQSEADAVKGLAENKTWIETINVANITLGDVMAARAM